MDQVRTMVENGDILNYDACVQNSRVWGLAAANKVPGDDAGLNNSRYKLCTNFYKTGSWRGGISLAIDDRKDSIANDWTPEKRKQFISIRDDITTNINNNMAVVSQRSIPAALDYPGAANEVEVAKNAIANLTARLADETKRITTYAEALQKQQSSDLLDEVSQTETKLRSIEKDNEQYRKTAELREEQVADVYNKYDSNYHISIFGYMPFEMTYSTWYTFMPYSLYINLSPTSRTGILFMAFFFVFAAIIALGVRLASYYTSINAGISGLSSSMSSLFKSTSLQQMLQRQQVQPIQQTLQPGRARGYLF